MNWNYRPLYMPSPIDDEMKNLPRGAADWPGYQSVYLKLQKAAGCMRDQKYFHLSTEHARLMAVIGCGHEETMKAELHRLRIIFPKLLESA